MSKRKVPDERDLAVLKAVKESKTPISGDDLYRAINGYFNDRRQFAQTIGGLTRGRSIFVRKNGSARFYSTDPSHGDDLAAKRSPKAWASVSSAMDNGVPAIYAIYTREALALVADIQARKIKPSVTNDPDRSKASA